MEQQTQLSANGKFVRRTEEEILKHLNDQEQSDFSVKEYCEMFDIVEQTFYSWLKKYRSKEEELKSQPAGQGGFAPIEVVPVFNQSKPPLFAEISQGNIRLYKEVPAEYLKSLLA